MAFCVHLRKIQPSGVRVISPNQILLPLEYKSTRTISIPDASFLHIQAFELDWQACLLIRFYHALQCNNQTKASS